MIQSFDVILLSAWHAGFKKSARKKQRELTELKIGLINPGFALIHITYYILIIMNCLNHYFLRMKNFSIS